MSEGCIICACSTLQRGSRDFALGGRDRFESLLVQIEYHSIRAVAYRVSLNLYPLRSASVNIGIRSSSLYIRSPVVS